MNEPNDAAGKKTILNLYALLGVTVVLSVLPYFSAALTSVIFLSVLLLWAGMVRKKCDAHSLTESHTTYIIRTIWISAVYAVITMAVAIAYLIPALDHAAFEACSNDLMSRGTEWIEQAGPDEAYAVIAPCMDGFISLNKTALINAAIIAGAPVLLFMAYRLAKGLSRALKGYRLLNEKSWF